MKIDLSEVAKSPRLTAAFLALASRKHGLFLFKLLHTTYKVGAKLAFIFFFLFPVVKRVHNIQDQQPF